MHPSLAGEPRPVGTESQGEISRNGNLCTPVRLETAQVVNVRCSTVAYYQIRLPRVRRGGRVVGAGTFLKFWLRDQLDTQAADIETTIALCTMSEPAANVRFLSSPLLSRMRPSGRPSRSVPATASSFTANSSMCPHFPARHNRSVSGIFCGISLACTRYDSRREKQYRALHVPVVKRLLRARLAANRGQPSAPAAPCFRLRNSASSV
jgi:hypothetical protein